MKIVPATTEGRTETLPQSNWLTSNTSDAKYTSHGKYAAD